VLELNPIGTANHLLGSGGWRWRGATACSRAGRARAGRRADLPAAA